MNFEQRSNSGQGLSHPIEQSVVLQVIVWPQPLVFEFAPQNFHDVEMRRIRGQVKHKQASLLPERFALFDQPRHMSRCIVQDNNRYALQSKRHMFQLFDDKACVDSLGRGLEAARIGARAPFGQNKAKQFRPLPCVLGMNTSS